MAHARRRKKVSLRAEAQPDAAVLAMIDAVESSASLVTDPEDGESYLELDAAGMDLDAWGRFLLDLLPGYVHGYSPSLPPDGPTRAEPGSREKIAVMRRRAARGMALHHPGDRVIAPPPVQGNITNARDADDA